MERINRRAALKTLGIATAGAVAGGAATVAGANLLSPAPAVAPIADPASTSTPTTPGSSQTVPVASSLTGKTSRLLPFEGVHQAGIVTPAPEAVLLASFDVSVTDPRDLVRVFKKITSRIRVLAEGWVGAIDEDAPDFPPENTGELGVNPLSDGNLSIMLGIGASLFEREGADRFGLARQKPVALKAMPRDLAGDRLVPTLLDGDIFMQFSSDHPMINLHAYRDILRFTKGQLSPRWVQAGFQRYFEAAPGEAKARGLLGFKDGTSNLDVTSSEFMNKLVWTGTEEPEWAQGGTYAAVRLIREQIERWDRLTLDQQEGSIGRRKTNGAPLDSLNKRETDPPDFAKDQDGTVTPLDAHIRRANPRLGEESEKRRMLRRGFLYFNGIDKSGLIDAGFLFMGFCRNVQEQFEFVKRNYMSNPHFPKPNTGVQDLDEYLFAVGGGYFFVPPGVKGADRFLADSLLLG